MFHFNQNHRSTQCVYNVLKKWINKKNSCFGDRVKVNSSQWAAAARGNRVVSVQGWLEGT